MPTRPGPQDTQDTWRQAFADELGTPAGSSYDLSVLTFDELRMMKALTRKIHHEPLSDEDELILASIPPERRAYAKG